VASNGRPHDRELLDELESCGTELFAGRAWRVVRAGRDPLQGSVVAARWNPADAIEALYTSLEADGALSEVYYHASLAPIFPSVPFKLYEIELNLRKVLRFNTVANLAPFGVNEAEYGKRNYEKTQAIGAAAHFLSHDGLIVPSARTKCLNLVVFLDRMDPSTPPKIVGQREVDWQAWRERQTGRR
jgi:hypothetical protein